MRRLLHVMYGHLAWLLLLLLTLTIGKLLL